MSTCPFLSITKGFSSWGFTCNLKFLPGFLCSVPDLSKQQKRLPFETMANGVSLHPHRTAGSGFQQRELGKPSKYILLNLTLEIHPPWLTHYVQFTRLLGKLPEFQCLSSSTSFLHIKEKQGQPCTRAEPLSSEWVFCVIIFQHFLS